MILLEYGGFMADPVLLHQPGAGRGCGREGEIAMTLASDVTLAALATTVPGAARVLERHRLDFCCRGDVTLRDACDARALPIEELLEEIRVGAPPSDELTSWSTAPLGELVDHILERYHAPLRAELPRLRALAAKIERVHAQRTDAPHGLYAHLGEMELAIEEHLQKEEQILFPLIYAGRGVRMPVRVMQQEHLDHAVALDRIRALTDDLTPPADACASWKALYLGLAELEDELHRHIALENHVLFPRALRA
jgi:regulator of cell morphogenesis and NO signaling